MTALTGILGERHQLFMQVLSLCHYIHIPVQRLCQEEEVLYQGEERAKEAQVGTKETYWGTKKRIETCGSLSLVRLIEVCRV